MSKRNQAGASSVEYGLIAFAIAALVTAIAFGLGLVNETLFSDSCDSIEGKVREGAPTQTCP